MVADRQRKDEAIGTIVVHETLDEFDFEPRSKQQRQFNAGPCRLTDRQLSNRLEHAALFNRPEKPTH